MCRLINGKFWVMRLRAVSLALQDVLNVDYEAHVKQYPKVLEGKL